MAAIALTFGMLFTGGGDGGGGSPLTFTNIAGYDIPAGASGAAIVSIAVFASESDPYTFSATGLPAGIAASAAEVISGTPTAAVPAVVAEITVTGTAGATKPMLLVFTNSGDNKGRIYYTKTIKPGGVLTPLARRRQIFLKPRSRHTIYCPLIP
ncbi:MAG: hypothetical protein LBD58_09160 [Treponema sp.]|jgi:hypothetical protein|nr:hypothetical protein [Treponema sp.]